MDRDRDRDKDRDGTDGIYSGCWVSLKLSASSTHIVGTVRYIGQTEFASGSWLGLVLVPECRKYAKNNGTVQGKLYFTIDGEREQDDGQLASNFGIFVRPHAAKLLSIHELIAMSDIKSDTKISLLCEAVESSRKQLAELTERLEITQVERECLSSETASLKEQLDALVVEHKALLETIEEMKSDSTTTDERDLLVSNKKLELSLAQTREDFQRRENDYLETIDSLKHDFKNLESKISSDLSANGNTLSDLNEYELIVERLTSENSELLSKIEQMNSKIAELERLVALNKDLNTCYEQTERELNEVITNLEERILETEEEMASYKNNLMQANEQIVSYEKSLESRQQNADLYAGMYKNILLAFDESFAAYTEFILEKISKPQWRPALDLIQLLYRLKCSSNAILQYCDIDSDDYKKWQTVNLKSEFILQLISYDKNNIFSQYRNNIESILAFLMHWIELNNEKEDAPLLLKMSLDLPESIVSYFLTEEGITQSSIDFTLLCRELLIYFLSKHDNCGLDLYEKLKEVRTDGKGIRPKNLKLFLTSLQDNDFQSLDFSISEITQQAFWDIREEVHSSPFPTSNNEELEVKVKILQSKLLDEKKVHHEIMQLERQTREHEKNGFILEEKLKEAKKTGTLLNLRVENLRKLLAKYGIEDDEGHSFSLADEFDILERSKLLKTIEKQRNLISKLNEGSTGQSELLKSLENELKLLALSIPKYGPSVPYSCYKRIDSLFDLCNLPISNSPHNHSYNQLKLLEYLEIL